MDARHRQRRMRGVERSFHQRQGLGGERARALDLRSPQGHVTEGVEREGEERVLVLRRAQIRRGARHLRLGVGQLARVGEHGPIIVLRCGRSARPGSGCSSKYRQRLTGVLLGLREAAAVRLYHGQPHAIGGDLQVRGAEGGALDGQRFGRRRDRLFRSAGLIERAPKDTQRDRGPIVTWTQHAALARHDVFDEAQGILEAAEVHEGVGEVVARIQREGMVGAEVALAGGDDLRLLRRALGESAGLA